MTKSRRRIAVIEAEPTSVVGFRGHLLKNIRDAGYEVHVFTPRSAATRDWLAAEGLTFHETALIRGKVSPAADIGFFVGLLAELRALRPELVLAVTIKPTIYGICAAAAAGVPRRVALITGLGYAFTDGQRSVGRRLIGAAAGSLYRMSLRSATAAIFQNADDRDEFRRRGFLGSTPAHVVNGSGVDVTRFAEAALPDAPRFLMIARLLRDKGLAEYLAAARLVKARRPAAEFDLVGATDRNPSAFPIEEVQAAAEAGVIRYHGTVDDVRGFIAGTRVYVLPSYREGLSRSVLEAMAMGRPIITTDAPGCRASVADGDNGLLVPVRSIEPLAYAMIRLIDHPDEAERMGKRSRALAEERFDVRLVTADLLRILGV